MFDNDIAFKPVDHPFTVVFGSGIEMQKDDKLTNIPAHEFHFKSFKEIQDGKFKTDVLYEITGVLYEIIKTTPLGTGKKSCTNIVLRVEIWLM